MNGKSLGLLGGLRHTVTTMAGQEDENVDELQRMASDNPAMTAPASQSLNAPLTVSPSRSRNRANGVTASNTAGDEAAAVSEKTQAQLTKYDTGWRRIVRNLSPSWFSVTMGTGIVSSLFNQIPFHANWLYWFSVIFFVFNIILFSVAFITSVLRYVLYPEIWGVMIRDKTNSLFLGTVPMGFSTLIFALVGLCVPHWGTWSVTFAFVLWIINSVVALAVTVTLPTLLIAHTQSQSLDRIYAVQLLPIASTIVAAGVGSRVADALQAVNDERALGTLVASYVMWGMATPLAMTVLVMYYQRLALYKLPPREIIVSSFLPLGPLGMGGYSIMYLGRVAKTVFPATQVFQHLPVAGDIAYVLGVFIALMMWAFGLMWMVFALASIYSSRPFPFNMGWWGFTFPLGVYAESTMQLGVEFSSIFFKVLGTIFATAVILLWIVVATGTAKGAWDGHLFYAPCLKDLKKEDQTPPDAEKTQDSEQGTSTS